MVIPFPINKVTFELRESSRDSTTRSNMALFMGNGIRICFTLLCFIWIGMGIAEAAPLVESSIDPLNSQAHFPLHGTVTITHKKEEAVDAKSFEIEDKPLEASFVKNVKISAAGDTYISIYSFKMPSQEKGLYVLPPISVKIGGKSYQSISSTYEVKGENGEKTTPSYSPASAGSAPVIFRLEATVQGPTTLYPGERTKLFYRISYNRSIDLTRSVLPMIHPKHFQKIGDVQIKDLQEQDVTIQELTQEVEATDTGNYQLGPSLIEGYTYSMKTGEKVYNSKLLVSHAPAVDVEVKPFPKQERPLSFNGALGQIQAEAKLESSNSVLIGDNIQLQVTIQGISNLIELHLPQLQCQPGFSGFFQMSDLPPLAEIKGQTKIFNIELRPLTTLIKEIPSIEVSSFDPQLEKYIIQQTAPIALKVEAPSKDKILIANTAAIVKRLPSIGKWPPANLSSIELNDISSMPEIKNSMRIQPWILWLLPISFLGLLYLQKNWREKLKERIPTIIKSEELFHRALKKDSFRSVESVKLLEQAFWQRLWEKGIVPHGTYWLDKIPEEKKLESIRTFLIELQALQFSTNKSFESFQLKQKARQLFDTI